MLRHFSDRIIDENLRRCNYSQDIHHREHSGCAQDCLPTGFAEREESHFPLPVGEFRGTCRN